MKNFLLFLALLFVVTLSSSSAPFLTNAAKLAAKEKASIKFDQKIALMDMQLKGEYLFVHDDAAMARGEACTYVYKGLNEIRENLVISFHCTPVERAKAQGFTVRTSQVAPGQYELREFQFSGSTEGHLVPASRNAERVDVAP